MSSKCQFLRRKILLGYIFLLILFLSLIPTPSLSFFNEEKKGKVECAGMSSRQSFNRSIEFDRMEIFSFN